MPVTVFTHPETGTTHILDSRTDQKTLRYPTDDAFYARSRCGCAGVHLREGDLDELPGVVPLSEQRDLCDTCAEHGSVLLEGGAADA